MLQVIRRAYGVKVCVGDHQGIGEKGNRVQSRSGLGREGIKVQNGGDWLAFR